MTKTKKEKLNLEIINLLQQSKEEIKTLRGQNEILFAKVEVMEFFKLVFHTSPNYPSQGMSEDVVWKIEKYLRDNNND